MSSALYVFGCSFSEDFKFFVESEFDTHRKDYVLNYLNGQVPDSWPESLSKKLNKRLVNRAAVHGHYYGQNYREGNCNASIFNNICHICDDFKKGDIIIVEWTFIVRYKWATEWAMLTVLPNQSPYNMDEKVSEEIIVNRYHKLWIDELFIMIKILNKLSESIGFDIYYWTVDGTILSNKTEEIINDERWLLSEQVNGKSYIDLVYDNGGMSIRHETNEKLIDDHLGVSGHNVLSDLFYNYINNNQRQTRFEDRTYSNF